MVRMNSGNWGKIAAVILFAALIIGLGVVGGYALRGEQTVTVERTVTVITSGANGSSALEKEAYTKRIQELTTQADQINQDFRRMVDRYNVGEVKSEDLADQADRNRQTYEEMSKQLTGMRVPPEFQQPHKQLISGFNKWQQAFEAYRDGFRENRDDLLDKARDLDSQAVIEVNQAINEISQI